MAPVLKDAFGNIIDGFHRKGENASWHELAVPHIDTPIKLELARLAVNFARRKVPPEELKQRIKFLMENGLKPDEIATKTGISKTTIYKYAPPELKDKKKAETGKKAGIASGKARETLGSSANQKFLALLQKLCHPSSQFPLSSCLSAQGVRTCKWWFCRCLF